MKEDGTRPATLEPLGDRQWLRERVVVDGGGEAVERGREWADALGVELVICLRRPGAREEGGRSVRVPRTFRPARVTARLVVVDAIAGHIRRRVRSAASPLLVARASSSSGRILVAVDFADPAEHVLELIAPLARLKNARVTLVHSIEPGISEAEWMANFGGSGGGFVAEDVDARRNAAAKRLTELLARYDLQGDVEVGDIAAAQLILDVAERLQPDLVALGAPRHRGLLRRWRRTTAGEVAASARGSVLIVPRPAHLHAPQ
jgi:nucleotide-binding universal stress UspA family protein